MSTPVTIKSQSGIKRDGTQLEGNFYTDGLWCRFQRGLPRKIGGFSGVTSTIPELVRGMTSYSSDGTQFLHLGSQTYLTQVRADAQGLFIGQADRTPVAYSPDPESLWQFDVFNNSVSATDTQLVAHPGANLDDISSTEETPIFAGPMTTTAALTDTGMDPVSGGIVVLAPYLIGYGSGGRFDWSLVNDFSTTDGSAFITGQKIVKGLPVRGGAGPAGIFWSLDSVIIVTFNPVVGGPLWIFNTVSSESSILSSQGVIEYDGIYFWAGVDRFLMYNGVVREVPNTMNFNFFYDNLNFSQRQKVFAYKVPKYGEIWWCFPFGNATECTHAVIYNVRENTWYDTQLPNGGRTAGIYAKVYNRPFMTDIVATSGGFTLWEHEKGLDSINGSTILAVRSNFTTSEISLITGEDPKDASLRVSRIEQDFVQTGNMTVQILGRANARAPQESSPIKTFKDSLSTAVDEQNVFFKNTARLMSFKFESNVTGGGYQMGQTIAHIEPADERIQS